MHQLLRMFAGSIQMTPFEFDPDIDACDFGDKDTEVGYGLKIMDLQAVTSFSLCRTMIKISGRLMNRQIYSKWWDGTKWKKVMHLTCRN